jgi:serine/threonine protein kinase
MVSTNTTHNDFIIHAQNVVGFGNSQVVLATSRVTGQDYAAKVMNLSGIQGKETLQAFYNEAQILKQLNSLQSPNIVELSCSSISNQIGFLIMEKMDGDLLDLILEEKLQLPQKLNIFKQICYALKQCHDNGIAHLDIKPENVLVSALGDSYIVKLADFGTSQMCQDRNTVSGVKGTLHYNAPEVFFQSVDGLDGKKADMWSLGILLHVLLTGTWPIRTNDPAEVRLLISKGKLHLSKELAPQHQQMLSMLLSCNPQRRPSIDDFIETSFKTEKQCERKREKRRNFFRRFASHTKLL